MKESSGSSVSGVVRAKARVVGNPLGLSERQMRESALAQATATLTDADLQQLATAIGAWPETDS